MVCYILWTVGCILLLFTVIPEVLNFLGGVSLTILIICGVSIFIQGVGYGMVNPLQSVLVADQFHKSQVFKNELQIDFFKRAFLTLDQTINFLFFCILFFFKCW